MEGIEYPVKRSTDINLSEVIKNLTGNNVICFKCKKFNDHFGCTVLKPGEIDIRSECERYEPIIKYNNKEEPNMSTMNENNNPICLYNWSSRIEMTCDPAILVNSRFGVIIPSRYYVVYKNSNESIFDGKTDIHYNSENSFMIAAKNSFPGSDTNVLYTFSGHDDTRIFAFVTIDKNDVDIIFESDSLYECEEVISKIYSKMKLTAEELVSKTIHNYPVTTNEEVSETMCLECPKYDMDKLECIDGLKPSKTCNISTNSEPDCVNEQTE